MTNFRKILLGFVFIVMLVNFVSLFGVFNDLVENIVLEDVDKFVHKFVENVILSEESELKDITIFADFSNSVSKSIAQLKEGIGNNDFNLDFLSFEHEKSLGSSDKKSLTYLDYQIKTEKGYSLLSLKLSEGIDGFAIEDLYFKNISAPLNILNFEEKSFSHYLFFLFYVFINLFTLFVLFHYFCNTRKLKILWMIFIFSGFMLFRFNWNTAQIFVSPFYFQIPSATIGTEGRFLDFSILLSLPLGAMIYFFKFYSRKKYNLFISRILSFFGKFNKG